MVFFEVWGLFLLRRKRPQWFADSISLDEYSITKLDSHSMNGGQGGFAFLCPNLPSEFNNY